MTKTSKSLFSFAVLVAIASGLFVYGLQDAGATPGLTYSGGTVHVTIPYRGLHLGTGKLAVEVLDPEDAVLGRVEQRVDVGDGSGTWRADIALAKKPGWRTCVAPARYGFTYANENRTAAAERNRSPRYRTPVVHIWAAILLDRGAAAVR